MISICSALEFNILENSFQGMNEISIAGVLNRLNQVQGCFMKMAACVDTSHVESIVAVLFSWYSDDFLLQSDQPHYGFKSRSRGVLGHQGTVEKWIEGVGSQLPETCAQVSAHQ